MYGLPPNEKRNLQVQKKAAKKDDGKLRYDLIPPLALREICKAFTIPVTLLGKYEPRNWEKGLNYMRLVASAKRHIETWQLGQAVNEEDGGMHHLSNACACLMMLLEFELSGKMKHMDDRNLQLSFMDLPEIICLCGSTKFKKEFLEINRILTEQGKVVLMPGSFGQADKVEISEEVKKAVDELHKKKIDLADKVFVVTRNGYYGDSTKNEITYAQLKGKPVEIWDTCKDTSNDC